MGRFPKKSLPYVAVLGCCKSKARWCGPARHVYKGALFRKSLAYAEDHYKKVIILSALYGLVYPDDEICPYEKTLRDMTRKERQAWAASIILPKGRLVYFCGRYYREFLPDGDVPLAGLGIGSQLKWFTDKGY